MGKTDKRIFAAYRPMPQQARFWVYSQSCYTAADLEFREWVIKTRANSGIHADYLNNPSSWFAEDSQALINAYPNSWFFSSSYKPRQVLTLEDFYVQPIDALRLNWPLIHDLMQKTGDYLLLRNQNLSPENLNQPMNYVLLDINHILKGLSQNSNMEQVQEQLKLLVKYARTIEMHVSPMVGSDRLFLANFREVIHGNIMPQITHRIESRVLQDRLHDLSKIVQQVSTERNRILHFALSDHQVNPHPYEFSISQEELNAYPTQAAKTCIEQERPLISAAGIEHPSLSTTVSLKECEHFSLITSDDEVNAHYKKAIEDLRELEHFQEIINQVTGMLDQAGEIYTIQQFKQQMLDLLENINHFLAESSQRIDVIIDENTQAYHKAIQAQQDLSLWKKWFTSQEEQIKTFIKNQDTLAQFPSGTSDLAKTSNLAQANSREIIKHLEETHSSETSFQAIADKAQELDKLIGSMHGWITTQQQSKGLPAPETPPPLQLNTVETKPINTPTLRAVSQASFFSTTASSFDYCPNGTSECQNAPTVNYGYLALGLMMTIPTAILFLYLLSKCTKSVIINEEALPSTPDRKRRFSQYLTKFEDQLAQMKGYEDSSAQDLSDGYEPFVRSYLESKAQAETGNYNVQKIKEAYEDLSYFYNDYNTPANRAIAS